MRGMDHSQVARIHVSTEIQNDAGQGAEMLVDNISVKGSGAINYLLTADKVGSGAVTSDLPGIDCGSDCTQSYAGGTVVTLTAASDTGWSFDGWSGACNGTDPCAVSMDVPEVSRQHLLKMIVMATVLPTPIITARLSPTQPTG